MLVQISQQRPDPEFTELLTRTPVTTLQLNLGKKCNQACLHCHVEAGPNRTEVMSAATADRVLELLDATPSIELVDITGGAPELCPEFKRLVTHARGRGLRVIDRCNLTILLEPDASDLAEFLAEHHVDITASMPCYSAKNVDAQRGKGVFDRSIEALQLLNRLGYGKPGTGLTLDLVYNPGGPSLPPPQRALEADYKRELDSHFGISFNSLFTITNMPIARFLHDLHRADEADTYMQLLVDNYNPAATDNVMCRNLVSVGYDGQLYDCDFNQMLDIPIGAERVTLWDIESYADFDGRRIATAPHCYGCTAGAGSSCGGALT